SRRTQAPNQLVNWCRGELVDVKHALLLYGVPESVSIAEIEETAESIKVLGKVVVRGKMFHPQQHDANKWWKYLESSVLCRAPD
uniref:Paraneoplastic antigen Ma-like N-terminal domain-containing protein n=1 Tax=Amphiprion ocellaris TaxID=80972 RepID=A0AAQ5YD25_AMPOC